MGVSFVVMGSTLGSPRPPRASGASRFMSSAREVPAGSDVRRRLERVDELLASASDRSSGRSTP